MAADSSDLLDQLLYEAVSLPPGSPAVVTGSPPTKDQAIRRVNYSHKAMIDLIIAHPGISQNALATHFGYTAAWVSQVMSSDAFQDALNARAAEIIDPALRLTVQERFEGILHRSLDILSEKLSKPADQIPDNLALRAAEVAARAKGYGAKPDTPVSPVTVEVHLEQLGSNLTKLLRRRKDEVVDAQVIALTADSGDGS